MKTRIIVLALVVFLLASLFINGCMQQKQTTVEQDQQALDKMLSDISSTSLDDINLGITDNTSDIDDISGLV